MSDYERLIQESLERENSLISCELDMERLLAKRMLTALTAIADRAAKGKTYGRDMHTSSQLVLEDIEHLARSTITHLNNLKGTT